MSNSHYPDVSLILPGSDINNATFDNRTALVLGRVQSPQGRGLLDIIWGSVLTIFLCTWTAVCLNIPHPDHTSLQILMRKAKWMFWAIVGPELVLSVAIGQYASARRSVERFRKLGYSQWTLRHAFFTDMGGVLLQPRDSTPFLVNSRQLAYLVEHEYVQCPKISAEDIWDKSKADTMTKVLTLAQASWLVIQLCGRAIEGLPTTTLELSAAAIVLCTFGTFICWLRKPSDVLKGIILTTGVTTTQILLDAGEAAAKPYRHTPLDFVAKESFTWSYDVMGVYISTFEKFALFCMTLAYASFHLIGWNFTFPTKVELYLWRTTSSIMAGTTLFYWIFETVAARQRYGRWDKYLIWLRLKKLTSLRAADEEEGLDQADAFEKEQKKAKPILWWEVALILPVIFIYAAARGYMIVEAFLSLRKLPLGVYQTVEISQIFPHW